VKEKVITFKDSEFLVKVWLKWVPLRIRKICRALMGSAILEDSPQNATLLDRGTELSPLYSDVFNKIKAVPGWFNFDDLASFSILLKYQSLLSVKGDIVEIGTYHGRSSCVLAYHLGEGEKLILCDNFSGEGTETYLDMPTKDDLIKNLRAVNPNLDLKRVVIFSCPSKELDLSQTRIRFAHVDGGHEEPIAMADLLMVKPRIVPGGIIAIDDYKHPWYPGVTEATDRFLAESREFKIIADLNRHGEKGRKLYLAKIP